MRYPPAKWKGDGQSGGSYVDVPWRVVLHTTETTGVPGYNDGGSAPHLTYDPKSGAWTQHTDTDNAARALRNLSGGVETNRARALQVEIICYSDKNVASGSSSRLWVGDLPDSAYSDLRAFLAWCAGEFNVQAVWPGKQAFSYSQANAPGFRMSNSAWLDFAGVCGHQHVPENDHWDPGAIDWSQLIQTGDDMALTEKEENTVRDLLKALEDNGAGTQASRQAYLDKMVKIGKNYPETPASGGGSGGLQRGDTVQLT